MSRPRDQHGFVLTEVLVVLVVSLIILTATLVTFTEFVSNSQEQDKRQETVEQARNALDVEARQLRNLARRVNNVAVIDTVAPYDFIFQTSDPSRTWVRYCLDTSVGADRGRLYQQTQSLPATVTGSPVTASMRGTCPGPVAADGWSSALVVADGVTNRIGGRDRAMFSYRCVDPAVSCTAAPATFDQIVGVEASLYINTTPNLMEEEMKVNSSVYLRNQNQAPTASAAFSRVSTRTMLFNASGSTDFENRTLQFFWFLNAMPDPAQIRCDEVSDTNTTSGPLWGGTMVGRGIVYQHNWPGTTPVTGATQTVGLVACDPGDRFGYTGPQTLTIPS